MRQKFPVEFLKVFTCLLLAVVGLAVSGCSTAEPDNASARPWNAPKGWENGMPMGLSEGR